MSAITTIVKRALPRKVMRRIREAIAYWRCRHYADPASTVNALGRVSPEWRKRIDDVVACPDNYHIPRVEGAGKLSEGLVTMHNGIRVSALGYYGPGLMNLLVENKGVHEPQEERAFAEVLRHIPARGIMIELGAYWGFYSLWFAQVVPNASCYLIEPVDENIRSGRLNFGRLGCHAVFERAFVGDTNGVGSDSTPTITLDRFCQAHKISRVSVLHADIQGAEVDMLRGAESLLSEKRIDYVFISSHSNVLHYRCIDVLKAHDYIILASADLDQTYSVDGVIVAKSPTRAAPLNLEISRKAAP